MTLTKTKTKLATMLWHGFAALLAAMLLASAATDEANAAIGFQPGSFTMDTASSQAGKHADLKTDFTFSVTAPATPDENLRDMHIDLPPGVIGNAASMPKCDMARVTTGYNSGEPECPLNTVVGMGTFDVAFPGFEFSEPVNVLIYNVIPYKDEPAAFAFTVIAYPLRLDTAVLSGDDYRVRVSATSVPEETYILGGEVTFWGVPAEHTGFGPYLDSATRREFGGSSGPGEARVPFLSNATSCAGQPLATKASLESWQNQGVLVPEAGTLAAFEGCEKVPFEPSVSVAADSHRSGVPAGYSVDLEVPQIVSPKGLDVSHLKDATVTLPQGTTLSPGIANGLQGCSSADMQIGTEAPASCPAASKIGTASVDTPLLPDPLTGDVFVGEPLPGNKYRLALSLQGHGVDVKLEGKVTPDPATGRLTATFLDNPQLPFSNLHLEFKGGPNAALVNPTACGPATTDYTLTGWSGAVVSGSSSFPVDAGCAAAGFAPKLSAGAVNPSAGKSSPFTLRITREDGEQNVSRIDATLPEGELAKLAGVPLCADAQAATGDCPAASQIGKAVVGVGAGPSPLYVPQPGKSPTAIYLAGPYKGAPYSLVVKVPAQAGPFDLGVVAVRSAIHVDPTTTQVSVKSDPLPQILEGIPLSYRDVRVEIDRDGFMVNPTSCDPMQVQSVLTSIAGATSSPSARFQVGDCASLRFGPKLKLSLKGATKRSGHPAATAVLTAGKGEANIGTTTVLLPPTEFIDNGSIANPCTRVQFNAGSCPKSSILGRAKAYSPLLDKPLSGPVYFRSNGGERELPDLVADLDGQIHVTLVGFIDSVKNGKGVPRIRTRFRNVPDAPVSRFVLELKGGKRGLLENSTNLCKAPNRATVAMNGQNGKVHRFNPAVANACKD